MLVAAMSGAQEGDSAAAEKKPGQEVRSLQLYTASLCAALPYVAAPGIPGYGLGMRNYSFFSPQEEGGFYWYIFATSLSHQAGGVSIADSRLVGAGWRKKILGPIGLDAGAAAITGARIEGNFITASGFIGLSPALGLYVDAFDAVDFGVMAEPVFMLWPFDSAFVAARNYVDVSIFFALKSHARIYGLPWSAKAAKKEME